MTEPEGQTVDLPPTTAASLAAVLADLPIIPKGGTAPQAMGGYAFRRVEDITGALKPLLAKYRIICVPTVLERIETERTTSSNKILFVVDLLIEFRFQGRDDDGVIARVWGQGTDSGDKATQKAVTSALKSMLTVLFCITDAGDDAELHNVDDSQPSNRPAAVARVTRLRQAVMDQDLIDWVREQNLGWPWTDKACDAIDAKLAEIEMHAGGGEDPAAPESAAPPPEPEPPVGDEPQPTPAEPQRQADADRAAAASGTDLGTTDPNPDPDPETATQPVSDGGEVGSVALAREQIEAEVEALDLADLQRELQAVGRAPTGTVHKMREKLVTARLKAAAETN
jgi:hypothetical protein